MAAITTPITIPFVFPPENSIERKKANEAPPRQTMIPTTRPSFRDAVIRWARLAGSISMGVVNRMDTGLGLGFAAAGATFATAEGRGRRADAALTTPEGLGPEATALITPDGFLRPRGMAAEDLALKLSARTGSPASAAAMSSS